MQECLAAFEAMTNQAAPTSGNGLAAHGGHTAPYGHQSQTLAGLLLVAVLAEPLLPLVRGDLVTLALFAAGHRSRGMSERRRRGGGQDRGAAVPDQDASRTGRRLHTPRPVATGGGRTRHEGERVRYGTLLFTIVDTRSAFSHGRRPSPCVLRSRRPLGLRRRSVEGVWHVPCVRLLEPARYRCWFDRATPCAPRVSRDSRTPGGHVWVSVSARPFFVWLPVAGRLDWP